MTQNKLEYTYQNPSEPLHDPSVFRVSASQIHNFTHQTSEWYRKNVLGEKMETCTALVLGTSLHYLGQKYSENNTIADEDREEIYDYIILNKSELVDEPEIRSQLTAMWPKLKGHLELNPVQLSEVTAISKLPNGMTFGGKIDAIRTLDGSNPTCLEDLRGQSVELIDYKTTSALNPPKTVLQAYKHQLYVYSLALKREYNITASIASIIYITKAQTNRYGVVKKDGTRNKLADNPPKVAEVKVSIDEPALEFIESLINLVADSVQMFIENPTMRYALMQDGRYRDNNTTLPFKVGNQTELEI